MNGLARRASVQWTAILVSAVLLGAGIARSNEAGFVLGGALVGALAIAAPAAVFVVAALVGALAFKGLVTLGLLPEVAIFFDIPLAWAALAVALLKRGEWSPATRILFRWLVALTIAVMASWAFHPSDAVRPFLYLALLAEPFAIVTALSIDPPGPRLRFLLSRVALVLLVVQIPIAYYQFDRFGDTDAVQGTLVGAGAGAHAISAVIVVGAIWLAAALPAGISWRLPLILLLVPIPLFADAKQVLFALPAIAVAGRGGGTRTAFLLRSGAMLSSLAILLFALPAGRTATSFIERTSRERGGKIAVAHELTQRLWEEPSALAFGLGPASTVSRAAFMTTDLLLSEESPLRVFDLRPASFAEEITSGGEVVGTSFDSGMSSALGVFGDLGLVGSLAYGGGLLAVFLACRRRGSPEARAAAAGWAMFAVLGFVFDWWEQPPFSVFLATLTGLALTDHRVTDG